MTERILHWGYMNYEDIPLNLCQYSHIEEIYLKENHITNIPKWFFTLKTLKFINLAGNSITELPNEIQMLENLEYLDVSENHLSVLPTSLGLLPILRHLNVGFNQLYRLPESIGDLKCLEHLIVSNNYLECLPVQLSECKQLQTLELSGNRNLWHIPERIAAMPSLKTLLSDRCSLVYLPANLTKSVQFLRIFDNIHINHIPIIYEAFHQSYYDVPTIITKKAIVTKYLFSVLENETNKRLLLPIGTRRIHTSHSPSYPMTLFDSCLMTLDKMNRISNFYNQPAFKELLPEGDIKNNMKSGPIARCNVPECSRPLFTTYYFIVVKRRNSTSRQLYSGYFCTQYCAHQWLKMNEKNYYEVLWKIL